MATTNSASSASFSWPLPTYNAATASSTLPTYDESLTAPERAFIADQTRLFNHVGGAIDTKPELESTREVSGNANRDPERGQAPATPRPQANAADGWLIFLSVVLLFGLPAVFSSIAVHIGDMPYSQKSRCDGLREPVPKQLAIIFGIVFGWLFGWLTIRIWRCRRKSRAAAPGRGVSVFLTVIITFGYCTFVAEILRKKVCF